MNQIDVGYVAEPGERSSPRRVVMSHSKMSKAHAVLNYISASATPPPLSS